VIHIKKWSRRQHLACSTVLLMGLTASGGCTAISIQPSCPASLRVGESGEVHANEQNPGGMPSYLWEAIPADAGTFANPQAPDTTFQALTEGDVLLRLTASDGLYYVISECPTHIEGMVGGLAVSLSADPTEATVDEPVTLTCTSVGGEEVAEYSIVQTGGRDVELKEVRSGVVRFTPDREDELVFECVGTDAGGEASEPAEISLAVEAAPSDNENTNDNTNDNENTNDNTNDNENTNDNANANENSNENTNDTEGNT
jgi:hypothetical protein